MMPEWVTPALEGPCSVNAASPLIPEDTVVIRLLDEAQTPVVSHINLFDIPHDKIML
jgi:hypothetical protein